MLRARMLLALAVSAALTLATVAGLAWIAWKGYWAFVLLGLGFVLGGMGTSAARHRRARGAGDRKVRRVEAALQRLALVAGVAPPAAVVENDRVPLSWTVSVPRRAPRVHVTTGLVDRLDDAQLEAVLAHELAHVLNRDAVVMTLLAAAPASFLRGLREMVRDEPVRGWLGVLAYGLWPLPTVLLLLGTARLVSRHRELAADRLAAELTGSPAAVAGALVALSEELRTRRDRDLRAVSARDVFHFLPAREPRRLLRAWATHPPLRARIEQLDRMERELQGA